MYVLTLVEVKDIFEFEKATVDGIHQDVVALQLVLDLAVREQALFLQNVQLGNQHYSVVDLVDRVLPYLALCDSSDVLNDLDPDFDELLYVELELLWRQIYLVIGLVSVHLHINF